MRVDPRRRATVALPMSYRMFSKWITCPRPNPEARLRLFCLPFAGGGASAWGGDGWDHHGGAWCWWIREDDGGSVGAGGSAGVAPVRWSGVLGDVGS